MTKHRKDRPDMILAAITEFTEKHGYPPTIRELMPMVGLDSTAAVWYWLRLLQRDGRIHRDWRKARARIVKEQDEAA